MSSFAFIIDRRVGAACRHWRSLLRDGAPERRMLDPAEMKEALPYLWICEEQGEDGGFWFRLAGEEVNRLFGESLRRREIRQIFAESVAAEAAEKFRRVLDEQALIWTLGPFFATMPEGPAGECAVMPLRLGSTGRGLLGVTVAHAAMPEPPRRLYPICQRREVVPLADLVPA